MDVFMFRQLANQLKEDLDVQGTHVVRFYNQPSWVDTEKYTLEGYYDEDTNTVAIYHDLPLENTIETLIHELRHAWQYTHRPDMCEDYVKPEVNYEAYYNCTIEKDAREYASFMFEEYIDYVLSIQ